VDDVVVLEEQDDLAVAVGAVRDDAQGLGAVLVPRQRPLAGRYPVQPAAREPLRPPRRGRAGAGARSGALRLRLRLRFAAPDEVLQLFDAHGAAAVGVHRREQLAQLDVRQLPRRHLAALAHGPPELLVVELARVVAVVCAQQLP